ncbi:MAG: hypothetical protein JWM80_4655 [Cyanobacteria bacterium RYN_339]|nr:hypothetical protein [Cyanobacteria bacterium RYN_339]
MPFIVSKLAPHLDGLNLAIFRRAEQLGRVRDLGLGKELTARAAGYQADLYQRLMPGLEVIQDALFDGSIGEPVARARMRALVREHGPALRFGHKALQALKQYRTTIAKLFA